jgi:hypothetical protein
MGGDGFHPGPPIYALWARAAAPADRQLHAGETMIDLYYWTTPNGHKVTLFLEETGLPHRIVPINIGKGEQFAPGFPQDRAEQPHPGHGRPRPGRRRRADFAVRIRRHPALPRRQDRQVHRPRPARAQRNPAVAVLADGAASARWPGRTTTSRNTRRNRSPTPSSATPRKPRASTPCSTSAWPTASSSPETIRSPTWPAIRGSCRTGSRARTSTTSRTSSAGSAPSANGRRRNAPTRWWKASTRRRWVDEAAKKVLFGQDAGTVRPG